MLAAFEHELQRVKQHERVCGVISEVVQTLGTRRHNTSRNAMNQTLKDALREQETWVRSHGLVVRPRAPYAPPVILKMIEALGIAKVSKPLRPPEACTCARLQGMQWC